MMMRNTHSFLAGIDFVLAHAALALVLVMAIAMGALGLSCLSASPAMAADDSAETSYIVYPGQLPPLNYRDSSGVWHGVVVDALITMMHRCGVPFSRYNFEDAPWPRAQQQARTIPGNMVISLARTPEREQDYAWIGPVVSLHLGLVAKKSRHLNIGDPVEIKKYKVCVIRDSAPITILGDVAGMSRDDMHIVDSNMQQFRLLEAGRVDMVTQSDLGTPLFLSELHLNPDDFEMVHVLRELPLYIAANKNTDPELLNGLRRELAVLKTPDASGKSELDRLLQRYLSEGQLSLQGP